jgi:hypothetical protein
MRGDHGQIESSRLGTGNALVAAVPDRQSLEPTPVLPIPAMRAADLLASSYGSLGTPLICRQAPHLWHLTTHQYFRSVFD